MIDISKIKFGDTIYVVNEKNNAFQKKKIVKIDRKGVEWFRYDRDHWEWSISEIVYCGKVTMITEGEVDLDLDRQDQMHFKYPDGNIYYEYVSLIHENDDWFLIREEAEAYIEKQKLLKLK